jgi:hypothetical protein
VHEIARGRGIYRMPVIRIFERGQRATTRDTRLESASMASSWSDPGVGLTADR